MIGCICYWIGWVLIAIGTIGCLVPLLPGPPIAYGALVLLYLASNQTSPSELTMIIATVMLVAITVLDYIVPAIGARSFDCSRVGMIGCVAGTIIGFFFLPIGVIIGPFLGALTGELMAGKSLDGALKGATGALLGYVAGIVIKLAYCMYVAATFFKSAVVG